MRWWLVWLSGAFLAFCFIVSFVTFFRYRVTERRAARARFDAAIGAQIDECRSHGGVPSILFSADGYPIWMTHCALQSAR